MQISKNNYESAREIIKTRYNNKKLLHIDGQNI